MVVLLLVSIFMVFFAYFGYPLSLWLLSLFRRKNVAKGNVMPSLTLIIAACNEEKRIRAKLENTLALDYPWDRLQVIVASDGSTDGTHAIVREFADQGIELLPLPERRGKENAQKEALRLARGEVIIFSDTATAIEPDGLRKIAANFADPTVGCVSSVDRIIGRDGKPCGEGFYVRYEMWLRDLESRVHSLVGLSGSFFAARREICRDFSGDMQSDFRTVLNSMKLGLRGVSDPETVGYYQDISDSRREFDRKVRTVLRGMTVFFSHLSFLNFFRYGLFSYQFLCHKLLRWLVPLFLLAAFASNAFLAGEGFPYLFFFLMQMAFYLAAFWGMRKKSPPANPLLKIPVYFLTVNAAVAVAWVRYLEGERMVMWTPSERQVSRG